MVGGVDEEWRNRIALVWANRTRPRKAREVLEHYASATEALARHPEMVTKEALRHADEEMAFIERHQIAVYYYKDAEYPYRLAQCVDAPLLLFGKGNLNVNPKHVVSIVGTRMPTERGKDWCRRLVQDLAGLVPDVTIVSGLAYGIDVAAHRAALEAGVPTIIIPAHGLDRIYPAVHREVAVRALENGGILTEYTCGTEPERYNFVARNRIIAGLADAVVVVESKAKGGSLITAQMAQDYDREVFALPGRIDDVTSAGCNGLIKKQQAQLIDGAEDIVEAMQWQAAKQPVQTSMVELGCNLSEKQQGILQLLREAEEGLHVNQIVMEMQMPYNEVSAELVMMELQDVVQSLPGGMWRAKG